MRRVRAGTAGAFFFLLHPSLIGATETALNRVRALSVTTWQQESTYKDAASALQTFKRKALVGQGANLLLASSAGVLDLAKCGAVAPWVLDSAFQAALGPPVLSLLAWRGQTWALPVAADTNVIYYNRALVPSPPTTLAAFVNVASQCATPMVLERKLDSLSGFFVGSALFPASGTQCK